MAIEKERQRQQEEYDRQAREEADRLAAEAEAILQKEVKMREDRMKAEVEAKLKAEFEKQGLQVAYEGSLRPGFPWKHHYVFKLTK